MLSNLIKDSRRVKEMKLKDLAAITGIDQTLISRFEKGDRLPTQEQLSLLIRELKLDAHEARVEWMAEKVIRLVGYESVALEALNVAETRLQYLNKPSNMEVLQLSENLNSKLLELDSLRGKWLSVHPLDNTHLERLHEYFDIDYTYESNRIEGNTLTLQETALVVNEGLTIGGKSVREHLEAINHTDAITFIRDLIARKESIDRRSTLDIHKLILKGIDDDNAGRYRRVPVRISGSETELPQPYQLDKLMEDYFRFYRIQEYQLHPVLLAAEMHERLVSIHPFIDGNGRTARLIMNLILMQHGFTRVNIKGENQSRLKYYRALEAVQQDSNTHPFYELVIDEAIRSLEAHLEWVF